MDGVLWIENHDIYGWIVVLIINHIFFKVFSFNTMLPTLFIRVGVKLYKGNLSTYKLRKYLLYHTYNGMN